MPRARRLRGLVLRLVLNRRAAIAAGVVLAAPGALLMSRDYAWESGVTDGLALLTVATGIALAWAGTTGRKGDWVE
jgi:4-amino-4-deoxy-L-arabinose transferase-like glycosyltransferase